MDHPLSKQKKNKKQIKNKNKIFVIFIKKQLIEELTNQILSQKLEIKELKKEQKKITKENEQLVQAKNHLQEKYKKNKNKLTKEIGELKAECEGIKEEYEDLCKQHKNSLIFHGKVGEDKNSRVSFEMFWLCTQLVTVYNVPEYVAVDVISFVLKEVGITPKNFPSATWVKETFSSGWYRTFLWLTTITFLNEYCEEDCYTLAADISSLQGQSVNCVGLFAKLKKSIRVMKIPLFMYEVTSKQAKKNLESFLTQLNFFEELNQKKYPEATPILSRVTSSLGDKDNSERCFQKMLEEESSKLRKDTELEEIAGWVHGTCFQHNLDGNIFIYFSFFSQSRTTMPTWQRRRFLERWSVSVGRWGRSE